MRVTEHPTFPLRLFCVAFILPVLFLLPFLGKAYHIDDTFYLYVARQILESPLDFYGFDLSWGLLPGPAYESNKNPPGVSYMIAVVAAVFGWREWAHHLFMAGCAGLLSAGTFMVARCMCRAPMVAVCLAVITPGFLVSSNMIMSDVPMMMLYVWAIWFWMLGLERSQQRWLAVAGVLVGLSTLTKYFGITAVPLLLAYTIAKQRRVDWRLGYLLIPVAMVALYQWYSFRMYGVNLFSDAAGFALGLGWSTQRFPGWAKPLSGLTFAGGCSVSLLFLAPWLWRKRVLALGIAGVVIATGLLLVLARQGMFPGRRPADGIEWYSLQYALMLVGGVQLIALAGSDLWRERNAESLLLLCWLLGTLVFSSFLNWTINARTILPLIPVAGILGARRLSVLGYPRRGWMRCVGPALTLSAAVTLCVLWADYRHAASAKVAAEKFALDWQESGHRYRFKGNWGFQFYMEQAGISAWEPQASDGQEGDRIVVPVNNIVMGQFNPPVARAYKSLSLDLPASRWVSTFNRKTGAGFYSHYFGPIPYAFGPVPLEEYAVYELGDYEGRAAKGEVLPIEFFNPPGERGFHD